MGIPTGPYGHSNMGGIVNYMQYNGTSKYRGRQIILFGEASALFFFVHPYVHKRAEQRCTVGRVLIWIQS